VSTSAPRLLRRPEIGPSTVLAVAAAGVSLAFVDATMVNTAFPAIGRSFPGTGIDELSWVLTAYNIVFAGLLLAGGRLADVLGRRRLFIAGVAVFTLGSVACAAAPSLLTLIAARMLQGVGAAVVVPASLAIVLEAYPADRRATGVALWSACGAAAAGLGPVVGGLIIEAAGWREAFLINVPIGLVTIALARRLMVESRVLGERTTPDLAGALLLAVTVALLALGIINSDDWDVRWWAGCLALALLVGAVFVRRCQRHRSPLVDLALLRVRSVWLANALTVLGATGLYAMTLCNVLFLTNVWHYDLIQVGLLALPAPLVATLAARPAAALAMRVGASWTIALGALIWAGGVALLATRAVEDPDPYTTWLPASIVSGLGVGIAFPIVSATAVAAVQRANFGVATALNAIARQIGAVLGVAALVAFAGQLGDTDAFNYQRGWILGGACFLATAFGALLLGRVPGMAAPPLEEPDEVEASVPQPPAPVRPPRPDTPALVLPRPTPQRPIVEVLAQAPLLAVLPVADRERLARSTLRVPVQSGEVLFFAGEPADDLYIVERGRVEELKADAAPVVLGPGAALGELSVIAGTPRSTSARARRDSLLLRVPAGALRHVLDASPEAGREVSRLLARELQLRRLPERRPPAAAKVFALIALDPRAPLEAVADAFVATLRRYGPTIALDERSAQDVDLRHVEEVHDHVVLVAPVDGPWRERCRREADRTVVVAGAVAPPPRAPSGCDLVFVTEPGAQLRPWLDALVPRTHQIVGPGADLAAGAAVAARRLSGRSVGVVLSSGGARGLAHIAVLEELQASGIVIDRVGGASMGALIGGMFASGMEPAEIDARVYADWVRRNPVNDYTLPRRSLIRGERVKAVLQRTLPEPIETFPRGFFCVAADLHSGEAVTLREGPGWEAVGASMCIPGFAPPAPVGGRLLVDGAIVDAIPVSFMSRDEGPIIAVDATAESRSGATAAELKAPGLIDTLTRVSLLSNLRTVHRSLELATLTVRPRDMGVGMLEFHLIDVMRESGRRAAHAALAEAPAELFG
jgi:NTE family protein